MELTWGPEFDSLSDVAHSLFARYSPLADGPADTGELYPAVAELDWLRLSDSERDGAGGADGASLGSIAALHVELGRALLDLPLLPAFVCRELALRSGHPDGTALAEAIGDGQLRVAPLLPDPATPSVAGPQLCRGRLNGTALLVPHAEPAERFVVGVPGGILAAVAADHPGIRVEPLANLADHPLAAVTLLDVPLTDVAVLAEASVADEVLDVVGQRSAVLQAAEVYGAGLELLARTVRYARQREQFGGPIGRFQSVQNLCTDIALAVHLTSVFARGAAALLDSGRPAATAVAMLRAQASRAARTMVHSAHEVHAGIGFMLETKLHLFTRAAKRWQFALGDEHLHHPAIAAGVATGSGVRP